MPRKKHPIIWPAKAHTIAKVEMLKNYLVAWFQILGRSRRNQPLLYIDGFAGPGEYSNYAEGSPLAAVTAAKMAIERTSTQWVAGIVHCAFFEPDARRFQNLKRKLAETQVPARIVIHLYQLPFVDGLAQLRKDIPEPFGSNYPLFAFIDPFGPTGIPFTAVKELLTSPCSELLINLDSDGVARIFQAGLDADYESNLTAIFGDDDWNRILSAVDGFPNLCRKVLQLYKAKLKRLSNVRYCFSFEMRTSASALDYHLVFVSQHPLGLEKMKEAMRRIDRDGNYCFSDARVNQPALFRFDDPGIHARELFAAFRSKTVAYSELHDFALNYSPFLNPKAMLKVLEVEKELIIVQSRNARRRKGTFKEGDVVSIKFRDREYDGETH